MTFDVTLLAAPSQDVGGGYVWCGLVHAGQSLKYEKTDWPLSRIAIGTGTWKKSH